MANMKKQEKSSINIAQAKTVEEHYKIIMTDKTYIDIEHKKITFDDLPDWFDEELFKIGQIYYLNNLLGITSGYIVGLISVFLIPSIAKILDFTQQSSIPCLAFKRYLQTILHIYNLHKCDALDPKSNFYKSINVIRWKHAMNSKRAINGNQRGILQRDMVLTQFGFVGYLLTHPENFALPDSAIDRQGINHFWRVCGHLLGIPERMNLCRESEDETTILCKTILEEVFTKHLINPNQEFYTLTFAAIKGIGSIDPFIDLDAFMTLFYKVNGTKYQKKMSIYSQLNYLHRMANFYLISLPIIGNIFRISWNVYLRCLFWLYERFPVLGIINYGRQ